MSYLDGRDRRPGSLDDDPGTMNKQGRRLPFVDGLLESIDSRALFQKGTARILEVSGAVCASLGLYAFVVGGVGAVSEEHLDGIIRFAALVAASLGALGCVFGGALVVRRAQGISQGMTLSDIVLHIARILAELAALAVLVYGIATALCFVIAGTNGPWAAIVGLLRQPSDALESLLDFFTEADSVVMSRIYGLFALVVSGVLAFVTLLLGYFLRDVLRVLHRFFARRSP